MYLIVSSTHMELALLEAFGSRDGFFPYLLTGVGPVETAINLTQYLCRTGTDKLSGVINIGLAGAYPESGPELLDICLAGAEVFGDLGICLDDRIDELSPSFAPPASFPTDQDFLDRARNALEKGGIVFLQGNFVTVSSCSGTTKRSLYLRDKFGAICENMEGAAVARVCQKFSLPFLELRCISNMVVDRADQKWRIEEAVANCGKAALVLMEGLLSER